MTSLGNLPLRYRPVRRLGALYVGLFLYGLSVNMMIAARLGVDSWDVFHLGLSKIIGVRVGWVVIGVGVVVLLCWIPLRQAPGVGTISNALMIGVFMNLTSGIPHPRSLLLRWVCGMAAILLTGLGSGLYLGARLGPGPRDGIMTGLVSRLAGRRFASIRVVRTTMEVTVLITGFFMGGTAGWLTLVYALAIGPIVHVTIPLLSVPDPTPEPTPELTPEPELGSGVGERARVHRLDLRCERGLDRAPLDLE